MENLIRGEVFKKYSTISEFRKAVNWSSGKASRIINGIQRPSAQDMEQIAGCLHIDDPAAFVSIFFPTLSTK